MTDPETVADVLAEMTKRYGSRYWQDRIERAMAASAVPVESLGRDAPICCDGVCNGNCDGDPVLQAAAAKWYRENSGAPPPASVPDGWMPIESAPKDGTPLLLCATRHSMVFPEPEVVVGRYDRGWWSGRDTLSFVTSWKPCPALATTPEESP